MSSLKFILFLTLQILIVHEIYSHYEIILEKFEVLLGDNDEMFENIDLRVKRFNRTSYVATGALKMKTQIDNSLIVGFKAYNMAGGEYKMMFERLLGPTCEMVYEDHMRPCVEEFIASTNVSFWKWGMCPIPPTLGYVSDYSPTRLGDYIPPYLPGGEKWKLSIYMVKNETEKILGGITVYGILRTNYTLLRYGG